MTDEPKPLVREASRKDYLIEEKNHILKKIVSLEIDIEVLQHLDEKTIVASRRVTEKSTVGITAPELLSDKRKELDAARQRLNAIEALLTYDR